jgi:superfamily I DNA/RNA helicase
MKIPYRVVGSQSFFDRKEVRDCVAYLQVLNSPISDVPLLRILNAPPRGIGQGSALLITECSRERECSIWEAMGVEEVLSQLSTKVRNSVNTFVELVLKYHERFAAGDECMGTLFHEFIQEVGYEEWMHRHCKTENERKQRSEGINDLRSDLAHATTKKRTLQKFLDHMALQSDKDDDIEKQKGVCMITLHASKGLEFPLVYLVGLENGILPHKRSLEEGTTDEERRLLYVGITRAQDEFTMSYCAWRTKYGDRVSCEPSLFLKELSFEDIMELDYDDIMGAEATEEETESFFDGLKSLLE